MNSLDVYCFTSVARTHSFSVTAKEYRISQQAVSKHIKNLEDEIGYQLFFRDAGMINLTKAGILILDYFEQKHDIIAEIDRAFHNESRSAPLYIGFSQWIGYPNWFASLISSFQKENPDISIRLMDLDADEMISHLKDNSVDILLTSDYSTKYFPILWKCEKVKQEPLYIIRSKRANYSRDQFNLYPFFAPYAGEENENAVNTRVKHICGQLGFTPDNITVYKDMGTVMFNVMLSNGMTIGTYELDEQSRDFSFDRTDIMVDIDLCYPYHSSKSTIYSFADYISRNISRAKELLGNANTRIKKGGYAND